MRCLALRGLAILLLFAVFWRPTGALAASPYDYPITDGRFYSQTGGDPQGIEGYSVVDDPVAPIWSELGRLGGVERLGYPISRRFARDDSTCQAFQQAILCWEPAQAAASLVAIFDELDAADQNDWLLARWAIPFPERRVSPEVAQSDELLRRHLELLDRDPELRRFYYADDDPIARYGLPVAVAELEFAVVVRLQRGVIQHWLVDTPWARRGEVTSVNAGEIAREAGLLPAAALVPEAQPVATLVETRDGTMVRVAPPAAELRDVLAKVRPSIARVVALLRDRPGEASVGTAVAVAAEGYLLTALHVVEGAESIDVVFQDGRRSRAQPVAVDEEADLVLLRVAATGLRSLPIASSIAPGQLVVSGGYGLFAPIGPNFKVGEVQGIGREIPGLRSPLPSDVIYADVPLQPGDSGGPVIDELGRLVGISTARVVARRTQAQYAAIAVPATTVLELLRSAGLQPEPVPAGSS